MTPIHISSVPHLIIVYLYLEVTTWGSATPGCQEKKGLFLDLNENTSRRVYRGTILGHISGILRLREPLSSRG
jgi:hypothetical protein